MLGLFIDKKRMEEDVKKIAEKGSECERKLEEIMYDRLVIMEEKINDEDHKKINIEIKELYDLINNSYKPVKKHFIKNVYSTTSKDFTLDKFKELIRMVVYLKLVEAGKIKIKKD